MSSNDLETMSQIHSLDVDTRVDGLSHDNSIPEPLIGGHTDRDGDSVENSVLDSREFAKPVRVASGKRRKITLDASSIQAIARRTRSGGDRPQPPALVKRTTLRPDTVEKLRHGATSSRKKKLQEIFEVHDNKVRELFHLTKFVTLADYDAKAAKDDESEVFQEVRFQMSSPR